MAIFFRVSLAVLSRPMESIGALPEQVRQVHHAGHICFIGSPTKGTACVPRTLSPRQQHLALASAGLNPCVPSREATIVRACW